MATFFVANMKDEEWAEVKVGDQLWECKGVHCPYEKWVVTDKLDLIVIPTGEKVFKCQNGDQVQYWSPCGTHDTAEECLGELIKHLTNQFVLKGWIKR